MGKRITLAAYRVDPTIVGGAEAYMAALGGALAQRGHDVRVLTTTAVGLSPLDRWRVVWEAPRAPGEGTVMVGGLGVPTRHVQCLRLPVSGWKPPAFVARKLQRALETHQHTQLARQWKRAADLPNGEQPQHVWGPGPKVRVGPGWHLPEFPGGSSIRWTSPLFGLWYTTPNVALYGKAMALRLEGNAPKPAVLQRQPPWSPWGEMDSAFSRKVSGHFREDFPLASGEPALAVWKVSPFRPRGESRTLGLYITAASVVDEAGVVLANADLSRTFEDVELGGEPGEHPAEVIGRNMMPESLGYWFDWARGPVARGVAAAMKREAQQSDAIIVGSMPFASLPWANHALGHRARVGVVTFRHPEDPYYAWDHYAGTLLRTDGALLLSHAEARGLPQAIRRFYIGGGYAAHPKPLPKLEDRLKARQRLGKPAEHNIIATLGRKSPSKGWRLIEDATLVLHAQGQQVKFWMAGPDEDRIEIDPMTTEYFGRISDDARADFYTAADVFVFASQSESFGLAILEAWAAGCMAVVADRSGPVAEVARTLGAVVAPGTAEGLADGIAKVLAWSEQEREERWLAGLEGMKREYDWNAVAERVEDFIGGKRPPGFPSSASISALPTVS